jgi:gamma-glutamylcyclotransferase (GGCT)/AIG2-like uncharacterized protein YtfP
MTRAFLLFVYGTLKRGQRAHSTLGDTARFLCEARVVGTLHLHAGGYPVLLVPEQHVLAVGTDDAGADAALQDVVESHEDDRAARGPGRWRWIRGELFAFPMPAAAIATIDAYEGIRDTAVPPTYRRILVPVDGAPARHAWAYAAVAAADVSGMPPLDADAWP